MAHRLGDGRDLSPAPQLARDKRLAGCCWGLVSHPSFRSWILTWDPHLPHAFLEVGAPEGPFLAPPTALAAQACSPPGISPLIGIWSLFSSSLDPLTTEESRSFPRKARGGVSPQPSPGCPGFPDPQSIWAGESLQWGLGKRAQGPGPPPGTEEAGLCWLQGLEFSNSAAAHQALLSC